MKRELYTKDALEKKGTDLNWWSEMQIISWFREDTKVGFQQEETI